MMTSVFDYIMVSVQYSGQAFMCKALKWWLGHGPRQRTKRKHHDHA